MSKYMLILRPSDESYANFANIDFGEILETMGKFNEELIRAGVLLAAEGLDDPSESLVVDFTGETPVVTDGPYGETKELTADTFAHHRTQPCGRGGDGLRSCGRPRAGRRDHVTG